MKSLDDFFTKNMNILVGNRQSIKIFFLQFKSIETFSCFRSFRTKIRCLVEKKKRKKRVYFNQIFFYFRFWSAVKKFHFFCDKYFFMLWVIPIKVSLQIHPLEILSPCFSVKLYFVKIKNLYFFLGEREGIIQFLFLQIFYFHKTKFYQI